jgi:hypothetical protein
MSEKEDEIAEEEFAEWLRKYGRRRESEGYRILQEYMGIEPDREVPAEMEDIERAGGGW